MQLETQITEKNLTNFYNFILTYKMSSRNYKVLFAFIGGTVLLITTFLINALINQSEINQIIRFTLSIIGLLGTALFSFLMIKDSVKKIYYFNGLIASVAFFSFAINYSSFNLIYFVVIVAVSLLLYAILTTTKRQARKSLLGINSLFYNYDFNKDHIHYSLTRAMMSRNIESDNLEDITTNSYDVEYIDIEYGVFMNSYLYIRLKNDPYRQYLIVSLEKKEKVDIDTFFEMLIDYGVDIRRIK